MSFTRIRKSNEIDKINNAYSLYTVLRHLHPYFDTEKKLYHKKNSSYQRGHFLFFLFYLHFWPYVCAWCLLQIIYIMIEMKTKSSYLVWLYKKRQKVGHYLCLFWLFSVLTHILQYKLLKVILYHKNNLQITIRNCDDHSIGLHQCANYSGSF